MFKYRPFYWYGILTEHLRKDFAKILIKDLGWKNYLKARRAGKRELKERYGVII